MSLTVPKFVPKSWQAKPQKSVNRELLWCDRREKRPKNAQKKGQAWRVYRLLRANLSNLTVCFWMVRKLLCKGGVHGSNCEGKDLLITRLSKAFLVWSVALFALLVATNNVFDYDSNFAFVQHVLLMDTTFEGNAMMWRSIESPWIHHLGYWLIISAEFLTAGLCGWGAFAMFRERSSPNAVFQQAKSFATLGLVMGIALWFVGFMSIGAEWFLMWQSETWNGQQAAFRFIVILFAVLIFLHQPEELS